MEKEIKIDLVPKEQINEDFDCVRITCENDNGKYTETVSRLQKAW